MIEKEPRVEFPPDAFISSSDIRSKEMKLEPPRKMVNSKVLNGATIWHAKQ